MNNYVLKHKKNSTYLLDILDQLLEIHATSTPKFFKKCLSTLDFKIYDKIIELSLSKSHAKNWSENYTKSVAKSKQIMAAFNFIEKEEDRRYREKLHNYCAGESVNIRSCYSFNRDLILTRIEQQSHIY